MLQLSGVNKTYRIGNNELHVLKEIDLSVEQG